MADPSSYEPSSSFFSGYDLERDEQEGYPPGVVPFPGQPKKPPPKRTFPWHTNGGDLDSYDLLDPTYDRDAWYTATRGADKAQEQVFVRMPAHIAETIQRIVAFRFYPELGSVADFLRSAAVHELHYRASQVKDPSFIVRPTAHTDLAEINALITEEEAKKGAVLAAKQALAEADGPSSRKRVLERVYAMLDSGKYEDRLFEELSRLVKQYQPKTPPRS